MIRAHMDQQLQPQGIEECRPWLPSWAKRRGSLPHSEGKGRVSLGRRSQASLQEGGHAALVPGEHCPLVLAAGWTESKFKRLWGLQGPKPILCQLPTWRLKASATTPSFNPPASHWCRHLPGPPFLPVLPSHTFSPREQLLVKAAVVLTTCAISVCMHVCPHTGAEYNSSMKSEGVAVTSQPAVPLLPECT